MSIKIKLFFILTFAFFLRVYGLHNIPSLNPDEAALGYNAYSLLETSKDEHGVAWPLHFKSFGDYKPGGYVYLLLPFIKLFGLNVFSVRLPNLILSVVSIYLFYQIILLISKSKILSLYSSLILALSPWHLHFSRGAWESNVALFLILWGTYLYFKKSNFFLLPLILSTYVYHSARIFSPLLAIIFLLQNYQQYFSKKFIFPLFFSILLSLPVLFSFINQGGTTRLSGVGILADSGPLSRSEELLNHHPQFNYFDRLVHNRRLLYFLSWGQKYFSHFNFNFLFLDGDQVPRSKSPEIGQLYLIDLLLIIIGIAYLVIQKNRSLNLFILSFLFLSPLASSLTFQSPSALRSLPLVIPLSLLAGLGLTFLSSKIKFIYILYSLSIFFFIDAYFIHSPKRYPFAWNQGFAEIIPYVESQKSNYSQVFFTNHYDQPYILYLFFSHYPPAKIQLQIKLTPPDHFGFSTVSQIDNIYFNIPPSIPANSLIIDAADFSKTGSSFTIYTK